MNAQMEALGLAIALVFRMARYEGQRDVAEHLLRALETMDETSEEDDDSPCGVALTIAYAHIAGASGSAADWKPRSG